jgi:hypothetical protein
MHVSSKVAKGLPSTHRLTSQSQPDMMIERPSPGQAIIHKDGYSLHILIPTTKNWGLVVFLSVWMSGWVIGEVFAITTLFFGSTPLMANAFLLFWLTGWTVGGLVCITVLLWTVAGEEIIKIENGVIEIGRQIFRLKNSKKYDLREVRHLGINVPSDNNIYDLGYQRSFFGLRGGILQFDYGLKTHKFASNIDEAEARSLVATFKANPNFKEENFD